MAGQEVDQLEEGEVPKDQCLEEGEVPSDEFEKEIKVLSQGDSDATDIDSSIGYQSLTKRRKKLLNKKGVHLANHCCKKCVKHFRYARDLKKHLLEVHVIDTLFPCKMCEKKFREEYHLRDHIITQHNSDSNLPCPICDKIFTSALQVS